MLREHLPGEPTSFCIIPLDDPRNQIKLTAKNRELKKIWAHHIKEMMLELYGDIPNRAKELLFKLGDEEGKRLIDFDVHFYYYIVIITFLYLFVIDLHLCRTRKIVVRLF